MDGEWLRSQYDPDFLLIHPMGVDDAGHQFGLDSRQYRNQARRMDSLLADLLPQWLGGVSGGDHLGSRHEQRLEPRRHPGRGAPGTALAVWRCVCGPVARRHRHAADPALRPDGRPAGVPHDKPSGPPLLKAGNLPEVH